MEMIARLYRSVLIGRFAGRCQWQTSSLERCTRNGKLRNSAVSLCTPHWEKFKQATSVAYIASVK